MFRMNSIQHVFILGLQGTPSVSFTQAVQTAFPGATISTADNGSLTALADDHRRALVVIAGEAPALAAELRAVPDTRALPRWPVVEIGDPAAIDKADNVSLWAALFREAVEKHTLQRENARLRGDLLTVSRRVNHDLRSSLNGIVTASEVMREILSADMPDDVVLVQPVVDSAAEIARIIEQVSFIAKASVSTGERQELRMDELVWKGLARVERRSLERHAHITHMEEWPVVRGVASWIEMMWAALFSNALEHGGQKPEIAAGWFETDDEQVFHVDDRGPGVPAEKRGQLFTPFHRLGEASSMRGFGLAVVQRLADLQGGRCGYEPRPDGARFYFTLPKN